MKTVWWLILVFMGLLQRGASYRVEAQSLPPGGRLLDQIVQAAESRGSAHIVGYINAVVVKKHGTGGEVPWLHIVTHGRTDQSYQQNLSESYQTTQTVTVENGKTMRHTERTHLVTVDGTAASQSNGRAWTCQTITGNHPVQPFTLRLGYPVKNPVNRGPAIVGGIRVWRVQGTITTSWVVATSRPVRADYYINRADGTLVRESASPVAVSDSIQAGTTTRTIVRGTISLTYSHWGIPLHPYLPNPCRIRIEAATVR